MAGRVKLHRGTHTRPDGSTVRPGESFTPTEEEEDVLDRRVTSSGRVFAPLGDAWERVFGTDDED